MCHTYDAARKLLGMYIARYYNHHWCIARITETECYTSDDPACHAYRGKTNRNASLFGPVGHAYVYMIYGIHYCVNIVAYDAEQHNAGGVLIRAVEPITGGDVMEYNRKQHNPCITRSELTNGPGKVAQAFAVDRSYDGYDVCSSGQLMLIYKPHEKRPCIQATPRIGITKACDALRRFHV